MALEKAKEVLAGYFPYPPSNATEAATTLNNFWNGHLKLPADKERSILAALTLLSTSEMGKSSHANDVKRTQRSFGQRLRKNRTGSRKG